MLRLLAPQTLLSRVLASPHLGSFFVPRVASQSTDGMLGIRRDMEANLNDVKAASGNELHLELNPISTDACVSTRMTANSCLLRFHLHSPARRYSFSSSRETPNLKFFRAREVAWPRAAPGAEGRNELFSLPGQGAHPVRDCLRNHS